jgi:hypothetical protein
MNKLKRNFRSNASGEGLVVIIIVLAIIGAGVWWLFNSKKTMDRGARAFGRQMIDAVTVSHDINFFRDNLGPEARRKYPNSAQAVIISEFMKYGAPSQPINIEESVTFESHFFSPRGYFTAHLMYPAQAATLQIAVSHPVGKWQLDDLTLTPERTVR